MRVFITKWFGRFARQEAIEDASLREALGRARRGLIDADLGGGLIKQRVARSGGGKSGGYRVIVAFRAGERAVFLLGFAKNERENISPGELAALRRSGSRWLSSSPEEILRAVEDGALQEVGSEQEEE